MKGSGGKDVRLAFRPKIVKLPMRHLLNRRDQPRSNFSGNLECESGTTGTSTGRSRTEESTEVNITVVLKKLLIPESYNLNTLINIHQATHNITKTCTL